MPQQVHFSSAEDMIRYVRQFGAHYMDLPTKFHTIQKNIDAYSVIMCLYSIGNKCSNLHRFGHFVYLAKKHWFCAIFNHLSHLFYEKSKRKNQLNNSKEEKKTNKKLLFYDFSLLHYYKGLQLLNQILSNNFLFSLNKNPN